MYQSRICYVSFKTVILLGYNYSVESTAIEQPLSLTNNSPMLVNMQWISSVGKLQMMWCDHWNNHLDQNVPLCNSLRYVYHPTSFTQLTLGSPVDGPLITLLCGLMLQMGTVGCIRSLIVVILSFHRLNPDVTSQL